MAAQDIEYVELYTSDLLSVVDYFISSFGFTWMAECAADGRRSSLLRHGTVQLVVTAGRGTEEFIEAHGTGSRTSPLDARIPCGPPNGP